MGGGGDDLKQEVLRATDIVALVSDYVPLRPGGKNLKALCPFHQEKTPSFTVSAELQSWHCWGKCATGGNAIDFVMRIEGLDFKSALHLLADRAGIRVSSRGPAGADAEAARARLEALELNRLAADFFRRSFLESREGERARRYVAERGIDEEWADRFQIGYAPQGGQWLLRFLAKKGYAPEAAARAGLAGTRREDDPRGPGHYDFFRGRLMFPVHDAQGRVVGFGGRTFSKEEKQKYINTPQSPVFSKRDLLYGLHLAKEAARERGEIAIVEGYTDVILAHQAGFPFFVATLGTAFGREHAKTLRRLVSRVIVFFDTDVAGLAANDRGLQELASAAFGKQVEPFDELRVAVLPDGQDPADAVLASGPDALARAIASARSIVDFLAGQVKEAPVGERAKALERAARVIAAMPHETLHYAELQIAELAHKTGVAEEVIRDLAKKLRDQGVAQRGAAARERGPLPRPAGLGEMPEAAARDGEAPAPPCPPLERWALACLFALPDLLAEARATLPPEDFADERARAIAAALYEGVPVASLTSDAARRLAAEIATSLRPETDYAAEWRGLPARIKQAQGRAHEQEMLSCGRTDDALRALYERNLRLKVAPKRESEPRP